MSLTLIARKADLDAMGRPDPTWIAETTSDGVTYGVFHHDESLWVRAKFGEGAALAFCLAYALGGPTRLVHAEEERPGAWRLRIHSLAGEYTVCIELPDKARPVLHWRTTLRPSAELRVQAWPRDIIPIGPCGDPAGTEGVIHAAQKGITGNVLFASLSKPDQLARGSFLYVQNLGALTDYFERTKGSAMERVGGAWPELGFELPPAADQPLQPALEYVLSDAYVCVSTQIPRTDVDMGRLFLELYACVYLHIPRPVPAHRDWPRRVAETARDLSHSPDCGWDIAGNRYMLAYAGSKDRPPESMCQLALLVPLNEWAESRKLDIPLSEAIRRNFPTFFDPKLKTIVRWLPLKHDMLQGQEEHMKPEIMDSWYLLHTYMNMGRIAAQGDAEMRELFFTSIEYGIRVAQRFDYQWPVFYDLNTLDVIKAETEPGKGGEQDVGALYAHVMLTAYDLSGDQRFVDEAKRAATRLRGLGFELGYQFNNVAFGAGALYRLWKLTGDEQYRGLSDLCWANMIRNLWLWDCKYGNAKHYGTFMGLAPLQNAPYLALYEELEVLAAIHEYMRIAGDDVPQPLRVLLPEYCKYLVDRAWFHYPSELPRDILAPKPQSGNLHRYLSVPVEDLYEGWQPAGQVGQEVYGASAPFIIATRHCHQVPGEEFIVHCTYPVTGMEVKRTKDAGVIHFKLTGDKQCQAFTRVIAENYAAMPKLEVLRVDGKTPKAIEGELTPLGYHEFITPGDAELEIRWNRAERFIGDTRLPPRGDEPADSQPSQTRPLKAKASDGKAKRSKSAKKPVTTQNR